jgi:hypothetical protein
MAEDVEDEPEIEEEAVMENLRTTRKKKRGGRKLSVEQIRKALADRNKKPKGKSFGRALFDAGKDYVTAVEEEGLSMSDFFTPEGAMKVLAKKDAIEKRLQKKMKGGAKRRPAGTNDKRRRRGAMISKLMKENPGMTLPEASRYIKDHGLM